MKHFVYSMIGQADAPAGGGTTEGWFLYYKWNVNDETFVPFPNESLPDEVAIEKGDLLWFVMDGRAIGCVPILYATQDPMRPVTEVYYHTDAIQAGPLAGLSHQVKVATGLATGSDVGLLTDLKAHFDASYPPRVKH